jgi:hypothetical protein
MAHQVANESEMQLIIGFLASVKNHNLYIKYSELQLRFEVLLRVEYSNEESFHHLLKTVHHGILKLPGKHQFRKKEHKTPHIETGFIYFMINS